MPYKNHAIRNTYQRQYAARKRKEAKEARQTSAGKPPKSVTVEARDRIRSAWLQRRQDGVEGFQSGQVPATPS